MPHRVHYFEVNGVLSMHCIFKPQDQLCNCTTNISHPTTHPILSHTALNMDEDS